MTHEIGIEVVTLTIVFHLFGDFVFQSDMNKLMERSLSFRLKKQKVNWIHL